MVCRDGGGEASRRKAEKRAKAHFLLTWVNLGYAMKGQMYVLEEQIGGGVQILLNFEETLWKCIRKNEKLCLQFEKNWL